MKKSALILLICLVATQYANAQNKKMYVSRHGGTKKILTFGKIGYNVYRFSNNSDQCDTLICTGSGFEICKIDKDIIKSSKEVGRYYALYNKAIRATQKRVRKDKKSSGQFNLALDSQTLSIKYSNADKKGNADIEMQVL
ncbi:MAG: hypothetical protein H0W61_01065 [Bacteroidetes bacterium]|nr:hypothetical protein [Bacteroidota bacterium]